MSKRAQPGQSTPERGSSHSTSGASIGVQQEPSSTVDEVLRGQDILDLRVTEENLKKVCGAQTLVATPTVNIGHLHRE